MQRLTFEDQVAIVTGAGGGLGRCHALELARRGARVVVNDLGSSVDGSGASASAAQTVVDEITAAGGIAIANVDSVATEAGGAAIVETRGTVRALERVSPRVAHAPRAVPGDASARAGAVRVRGDESLAMYPAGGAAVDPADAVLRFAAVPGSEKYAVAVEDEAGNTVYSAQTGATRVSLPREVLREGAVHFWRVRPRGPGLSGTAREERFVTLSADEARRWAAARADLPASDPGLRNLLSATASSLGLRREACLFARPAAGAADEGSRTPLDCESLAPFLSAE